MPTQNKTQTTTTTAHNPLRTLAAAFFGTVAVVLILSSLVSVWLNRTLTDTNTYVAAVAPLATKPAIQNFVAQKIGDEVLKNAPPVDLANALLPASQVTGQSPDQLKALLTPVLNNQVMAVLQSPGFAELWKSGNQTAHSQLITQLNSNSPTLELNLNSVVVGVTNQLKASGLAQFSSQIQIPPEAGKVNLKGSGIDQARLSYQRFKASTIIVVVLSLICLGLALLLSTHHLKTLRRILLTVGIISLLMAGVLQLPSVISIKSTDAVTQKAVATIVQTVFHSLQVAEVSLGVICIAVAIGTKLYEVARAKA